MSRLANSSSFTILKDAANWHSMVRELCVLICCVYYSFIHSHNIIMTLICFQSLSYWLCACCFMCRLYSCMDCLFSFYTI